MCSTTDLPSEPPPPYSDCVAWEHQNSQSCQLVEDTDILSDPELRELNEICLPRWKTRICGPAAGSNGIIKPNGRHVARPERPEYATVMGLPPNPRWKAVLTNLRDDMRIHGLFLDDFRPYRKVLFPLIASILYARDCDTHLDNPPTPPTFSAQIAVLRNGPSFDLFERAWKNMLRTDYSGPGVKGPRPLGRTWKTKRALFEVASTMVHVAIYFCHYWSGMSKEERGIFWHQVARITPHVDPSDFGMMLYHLHTNQKSRWHNDYLGYDLTYSGALQTLIDSIPVKGPEGLARKLSVDYHVVVPQLCDDDFQEACKMKTAIRQLARLHCVELTVPTNKTVERHDAGWEKGVIKGGHRSYIPLSIRFSLWLGAATPYG
ncbi:hypothetical protein PG991_013859 [Apiospora marii]|uniref:Uncharacterized protein n=1 Tax=Apiospora marii TaxID=335849 RepID=A0ABR1R805_9PEZI